MSIMGAIWKFSGSWFLRFSFRILTPDLSIFTTVAGRDAAHAATDSLVVDITRVGEVDGVDADGCCEAVWRLRMSVSASAKGIGRCPPLAVVAK